MEVSGSGTLLYRHPRPAIGAIWRGGDPETSDSKGVNDPKRPLLTVVFAFTTLAVVAYAWSVGGGFLNWDDPTYIRDNHELREGLGGVGTIFSTFHFANYNPLHRLSYLIEWQCFGDNATAFCITNLVLLARF